ncbi:hypothetical protein M6B38_331070 [Iris pallida]|uniref:Uncharacterized protein n=1 Tax=Iris pallida TaxID=29817 RepID=A0AAX6H332_IRIPA|nr:hypothetical protein M6B38_331070 [Iris pallida]
MVGWSREDACNGGVRKQRPKMAETWLRWGRRRGQCSPRLAGERRYGGLSTTVG